jgi:hypothetical protein
MQLLQTTQHDGSGADWQVGYGGVSTRLSLIVTTYCAEMSSLEAILDSEEMGWNVDRYIEDLVSMMQ